MYVCMYVCPHRDIRMHIQTHADACMTGMITSTAFPTSICGVLDECQSLSELMRCLKAIYDNIEISTFRKAVDIHNDDSKHVQVTENSKYLKKKNIILKKTLSL